MLHEPIKQTCTFEEVVTSTASHCRIKLSYNGQDRHYLTIDSGGWCTWGGTAQVFNQYVWSDGKTYLQVVGGSYDGKWLSVSGNAYVGAYKWSNATDWTFPGTEMVSGYNDQPLSFYSDANGHVYCWKPYRVFQVSRQ